MVENLVTIAAFFDPAEAHLAKGLLEAEGIESYIFDESMGSMSPYNIAVGGVKLKVKSSDAPKAKAVLEGTKD